MAEIFLDKNQLKETLKIVILEIFQEHKDEFSEFIAEVIEDVAMIKAIEEGENEELVERNTILKLLEQKS